MDTNDYFIDGLRIKSDKVILEIYTLNFPKVKHFVINNKGQIADAEDVFQKAILQIMARTELRQFKIEHSFEAYLYVACKNLWRRELNKRKRLVTNDGYKEHSSDERDLALSVLEQERWEFFQEKLKIISGNCREILKYFFNKTPYKVIAQELDYTNENVVRQRVFKCKSKLAEMIKTDKRFNQLKNL